MEERASSTAGESAARPVIEVTPRAIVTGAIAVATLGVINPYLAFVSRTWTVGSGSLLNSPVFVLFLLVAANTVIIRFWPGRSFTRGELLVVYGMLIISVGLAMQGGLPYIVSCVTFPFYRASPGNQWEHLVLPYVPAFLSLNKIEYVSWFWEGSPAGAGVPWAAWLTPLMAWGSFTLALMLAMFSLGALLRKDWIERQRLAFPLVDVPLAVTGDDSRPSLGSSILNNRVFWIGFGIPAVFVVLEWFHMLYPSVPSPQLYAIEVGRYFAAKGLPWSVLAGSDGLRVSILFPVIGITCLLPAEVSLSLWLFYILFQVQMLAWASFGVAEEGGTAAIAINPRMFIAFQEAGGFLVIAAVALWQSRKAFTAALLQLLGRARAPDDPYAPLSERWALVIFLATNVFMFWWAERAGMVWWGYLGLMIVFYAVLIGASRLVAAGGVMYVDTGFWPRTVMLGAIGSHSLGPQTLTMYSYLSVIYMYDPMNLGMPQAMNSFKLLHSARLRGTVFSLAAVLALTVMIVFGVSALLQVIHAKGAAALPRWPFTSYPQWGFGELDAVLRTPQPPDNWLRLALVLGAGFTLLLVWLHTHFVWWPVSPVGFLIASSYETNRSMWVNVFIAWLLTTVIRRYGGLRLFRTFRPAFLGLVLGDYLPRGFFAIVSSVFGITQPMS